jgi:hypothetical protein
MRQPAYIFSTLDDEPIVPALSDFQNNYNTVKRRQSNASMDHQTTSTTLRTSTKKPLPQDELEELELDHLIQDKNQHKDKTLTRDEEEPQTLNKRDYGNFALLVTLCKFSLV